MQYVLGLDLGITSIGWAVYNINQGAIINLGVRLFDAAENPKDKSPLAEPRRIARGQRRRIRRRAHRMSTIKKLLVDNKIITQSELDNLYQQETKKQPELYNVYYLRYRALDHLLSQQQLAQVLIHLAKHRGFKSNRKKDKSQDGKVNDSLKENHQYMLDKGYRSIGEMLYLDDNYSATKRNRFGEYKVMLQRSDIADEAKLILKSQQELGSSQINEGFTQRYLEVFAWQKLFDWRGNIIDMVGSCQFEKNEKRAPKACFSSEKFIALSKLNNIRYTIDSIEYRLSAVEIKLVIGMVLSRKTKSISINFSDLRKELGLSDLARFNFVKYDSTTDFFDIEKSTKINELEFKSFHLLKQIITAKAGEITWANLAMNVKLLDVIATELTYKKTDDTIKAGLLSCFATYSNNFSLDEQSAIIQVLIDEGVSFDKNISLSLSALYKIIPYLEQGQRYDEACASAGYQHSGQENKRFIKLPSIQELGLDQELTNPIVTRAISQLRKVVNAIIHLYGSPYQINIELARDIGKSVKQRNEISKSQEENKARNDKLADLFLEHFGRAPAKDELLKFRLYKQQDGKCIYSGEAINLSAIRHGENLTQIDHIIPISRSFDDSLSNKVLCLTSENQRKGNQTPFEYISANGTNDIAWHKFEERCGNILKQGCQAGFNYKKYQLLLLKKFDQEGFIKRNLNDTRYIARFCSNYLKDHLQFSDSKHRDPVCVLTGQATAFIRSHWGLIKSRDADDLHHAQDACVIAAVTTSMLQKITSFMQAKSYGRNADATYTNPDTRDVFDRFPMPNSNFRSEVIGKLKDVFVSRMPKRSIGGAVHDAKVRSHKYVDNPVAEYNKGKPFSTINKQLTDSGIKLDKDGEVSNLCPTYKQHNPNIYKLIQQRLEQFDNDCKKAFAEPLYAPRKDGSPSDIMIKTVKTIQTQNTGVKVNSGIADNGGMVRVDIFSKDGKNYIVPIYLSDVIKKELPNRAIVQGKDEEEWQPVDSSFKFLFSFYPNDLIKIITKKETYFGYYTGAHRGVGALSILMHDGSKEISGIGVKLNTLIEKYSVDVLGAITKVNHEVRQNFTNLRA